MSNPSPTPVIDSTCMMLNQKTQSPRNYSTHNKRPVDSTTNNVETTESTGTSSSSSSQHQLIMVANPQARTTLGRRIGEANPPSLAPKLPLKGHSGATLSVQWSAERQNWVVVKTVPSTNAQNGERLLQQVEKQVAFLRKTENVQAIASSNNNANTDGNGNGNQDQQQENWLLRRFSTAKVLETTSNSITMEYLPHQDVIKFLQSATLSNLDWLGESIVLFVKLMLQSCTEYKSLQDLLPDFEKKANQVIDGCKINSLTSSVVGRISTVLSSVIDEIKQSPAFLKIKVPVGECHGDLTLTNLLIASKVEQIYLLDFLSCFIESPLQDIVKLRQDTYFHWIILLEKIVPKARARLDSCLQRLDTSILNEFGRQSWWPATKIFQTFALARILPYATDQSTIDHILRCLDACMNMDPGQVIIAMQPINQPQIQHFISSPVRPVGGMVAVPPPLGSNHDINTNNTRRGGSSVTLVVPAAGRSSRFPGTRPKWLLTQPSGNLMVVEALSGLDVRNVSRTLLGVLEEHIDEHCGGSVEAVRAAFIGSNVESTLEIIVIPEPTVDQVATVEYLLRAGHVEGSFFVKDCDNYFECPILPGNQVSTLQISRENEDDISNVASKSYAVVDQGKVVECIVEKIMVSSTFCTGGYGLLSAREFLNAVDLIRQPRGKFYVTPPEDLCMSDTLWMTMLLGQTIFSVPCIGYEDWGTLTAWRKYCDSFRTIFIDLDGCLVKNSGQHFQPVWGTTDGLTKNIEFLRQLYNRGRTTIIITTSRTQAFADVTIRQLKRLEIPYHQILFGLPHCTRYLVNDYAVSNPFPAAIAVNLERNAEVLKEMLG
jgi:hypothetical protein